MERNIDTYRVALYSMYDHTKYESISAAQNDFSKLLELITEVDELRRKNKGLKQSLDNANEKLEKMQHYIAGRKGIGVRNR